MKIEVKSTNVPYAYVTNMRGNRPGLYIDKVGDIWVTDRQGTFIGYFIPSGGVLMFGGKFENPKDYLVRWLSPHEVVSISNEMP